MSRIRSQSVAQAPLQPLLPLLQHLALRQRHGSVHLHWRTDGYRDAAARPGQHEIIPPEMPGARCRKGHGQQRPARDLRQQQAAGLESMRRAGGSIRRDHGRNILIHQQLVVIAQRLRAGARGGTADHLRAQPARDGGGNFAINRGADEEAELQALRHLQQQVARAEQFVLVPVARQQRGRRGERRLEVLRARHADDAAAAPPGANQQQGERRGQGIGHLAQRRQPAPGYALFG